MTYIYICNGAAFTVQAYTAGEPVPDGWSIYEGDLAYDADGNLQMVCENGTLRQKTAAELKADAAAVKQEEIYREQEIRSKTVYGEQVSRHFFAWIEELYTAILKPAARNNITEVDAPITWGLKQLRDNRDTLLLGLQSWIDNPAKTADDIRAFDVVNWSGWSIARPN